MLQARARFRRGKDLQILAADRKSGPVITPARAPGAGTKMAARRRPKYHEERNRHPKLGSLSPADANSFDNPPTMVAARDYCPGRAYRTAMIAISMILDSHCIRRCGYPGERCCRKCICRCRREQYQTEHGDGCASSTSEFLHCVSFKRGPRAIPMLQG